MHSLISLDHIKLTGTIDKHTLIMLVVKAITIATITITITTTTTTTTTITIEMIRHIEIDHMIISISKDSQAIIEINMAHQNQIDEQRRLQHPNLRLTGKMDLYLEDPRQAFGHLNGDMGRQCLW
jgi:hypothetical protein